MSSVCTIRTVKICLHLPSHCPYIRKRRIVGAASILSVRVSIIIDVMLNETDRETGLRDVMCKQASTKSGSEHY